MTNTNSEIGSRVIKALNEFVDSHSKVLIHEHEYKVRSHTFQWETFVRYDPNNDNAGTFYGIKSIYQYGMPCVSIFTPAEDMFDMSELASCVREFSYIRKLKPDKKVAREQVIWQAFLQLLARSITHFEVGTACYASPYYSRSQDWHHPCNDRIIEWKVDYAKMYENGKVVSKTENSENHSIKTLIDRL